jgi:hypothetical protein
MYERFTDRARKVMHLANQEAMRFKHEYVGTEHILLGLVREGSGVAASVFKNFNIDPRRIRLELEMIMRSGPDIVATDPLPQSPRAKQVIERAIEEASNLHHHHVGTEHLVLGLLREPEGMAAQVLTKLSVTAERVRQEVLKRRRPPTITGESVNEQAGRQLQSPVRKAGSPRACVEAMRTVSDGTGERGEIARLEQRAHALERQLSTVRFLLGSILGAGAGILLNDRPGAVYGLIAGGAIALFGRLIPALVAGAIAGGLIAYGQFADEIAAVPGVVAGTLLAGCVLEIGRPVRRNPSTSARDDSNLTDG